MQINLFQVFSKIRSKSSQILCINTPFPLLFKDTEPHFYSIPWNKSVSIMETFLLHWQISFNKIRFSVPACTYTALYICRMMKYHDFFAISREHLCIRSPPSNHLIMDAPFCNIRWGRAAVILLFFSMRLHMGGLQMYSIFSAAQTWVFLYLSATLDIFIQWRSSWVFRNKIWNRRWQATMIVSTGFVTEQQKKKKWYSKCLEFYKTL